MFTKTTEYALRAVIYIAGKGSEEKKLSIQEIAHAINAPQHFTAKILQQLSAENKVISSVRGPNGGFFMTMKTKKKPIMEILKLLGEDVVLDKCVLGLNECSGKRPCPLHVQYIQIRPQLREMFKSTKIIDLTNDIELGKAFIRSVSKKK
ncbi:MAG TPA: Rrf2 family transcriptional regulator [Chitinophagaceae bacterium]|nr:Rrf2 family transcriptional regulator [Chitinophagaceae bacterium]